MNKFVLVVLLLLLTSCEWSGRSVSYVRYYNGKLSERDVVATHRNNLHTKKYCVHSLSYLLPINFWNVRFTDEAYIRKAIKDLNKDGIQGENMKDISIEDQGIGTPIYSYYCIEISGEVFE